MFRGSQIWSNLTKGEAALASSRLTGWFLIAAVCFFNTIPLLIISALANLASISEYVGFLDSWSTQSPFTFSLASGEYRIFTVVECALMDL